MNLVVGTKIKAGSMTLDNGKDVDWDKCRISLVVDGVPDTFGKSAEIIMIKKDDFKRITGLDYKDHMQLVDKEVAINYTLVENKPVLSSLRIINPGK